MSLSLQVAGLAAFTVSAFTVLTALGWAVLGSSCLALEWAVREEKPR